MISIADRCVAIGRKKIENNFPIKEVSTMKKMKKAKKHVKKHVKKVKKHVKKHKKAKKAKKHRR